MTMEKVLFGILVSLCFLSCSLKYDEAVNAETVNPEFIFYNTKITRFEDGKKSVEIQAENIERYKNSEVIYGKQIDFSTFDKKQALEMEGSCGYLFSDTENEVYELYDGIKMFSNKQNTNFTADILRWNSKTEQLTSGRNDMVRLEKDGTVIIGSGFSASGISGKFTFTGSVSGDIETNSKSTNEEQTEKKELEK